MKRKLDGFDDQRDAQYRTYSTKHRQQEPRFVRNQVVSLHRPRKAMLASGSSCYIQEM